MTLPDPTDPSLPDPLAAGDTALDRRSDVALPRWRSRPVELLGDAALQRPEPTSWFGALFDT